MLAWQGFTYGRSEPADAEGAREVQLKQKASCGAWICRILLRSMQLHCLFANPADAGSI